VPEVEVVHADDLVMEMRLDSRSAVVALTHDPKLDDLALMEALKSDAFYIGAIGSRSNNAKRRERLAEFDLTEAQIARLHGPIGLYIGSKTPSEFAISVLAEVTAVKNGVMLPDEMRMQAAKDAAQVEPAIQASSIAPDESAAQLLHTCARAAPASPACRARTLSFWVRSEPAMPKASFLVQDLGAASITYRRCSRPIVLELRDG
jgi:hypothetical protein